MNQIEQVIAAAKLISANGNIPSIALLKSRVGNIPLPVLIQGLQQYRSMSASSLTTPEAASEQEPVLKSHPGIKTQTLEQKVIELEQKIISLEDSFNKLMKRLDGDGDTARKE